MGLASQWERSDRSFKCGRVPRPSTNQKPPFFLSKPWWTKIKSTLAKPANQVESSSNRIQLKKKTWITRLSLQSRVLASILMKKNLIKIPRWPSGRGAAGSSPDRRCACWTWPAAGRPRAGSGPICPRRRCSWRARPDSPAVGRTSRDDVLQQPSPHKQKKNKAKRQRLGRRHCPAPHGTHENIFIKERKKEIRVRFRWS